MTIEARTAFVEDGVGHAPRGAGVSCKGWEQEAALRMLMNCADPDVAERPGLSGAGKAARDWDGFHATLAALRELEDAQTLLVRSDRPAGVFGARAEAPRVVIAAENVSGPGLTPRPRVGSAWERRPGCRRLTKHLRRRRENILEERWQDGWCWRAGWVRRAALCLLRAP